MVSLSMFQEHFSGHRVSKWESLLRVYFQVASYMRAVNDVYDKVDFDGIKLINFKVKSLRVRTLGPKSQQAILYISSIKITSFKG